MNKTRSLIVIALGIVALLVLIAVRFSFTGNFEGIFLLEGRDGYWLEVKDDLYLNEGSRYLAGIDFAPAKKALPAGRSRTQCEPYLDVSWNERTGSGYVRNILPGGKEMLTCLSRFVVENGTEYRGLFVGGSLPANAIGDDLVKKDETGMAYYDGIRWFHIWCNVNEAICSLKQIEPVYPSSWKFLGSRVLNREQNEVLLESSHEAVVDGVPLRIDRYAAFRAGDTYFILSIFITNIGDQPVTYSYQYGDEPWLGNYGSSEGNVGWTVDGLVKYVGIMPPNKYSYAGFFDYGNDAIGEGHNFTGVADFLEWFGQEQPMLYYTNGPFESPRTAGKKTPLSGDTRFIGLQWGPRTILPDESVNYTLAVGMADRDPKTGFPVVPRINTFAFP